MGNIKDIVDLASQLESRAKDRKDIETLRAIISLTHSIQSNEAEIVERDIRVMQENAQLIREKIALELQLATAQSEDVRIYKAIEFRQGKRTGQNWMAFCPKCHMPAQRVGIANARGGFSGAVTCSARCGWKVFSEQSLDETIAEIQPLP